MLSARKTAFDLLAAALVGGAACSSSTEPKIPGGGTPGNVTHPVGTLAASVPVGFRPFGIALSGNAALVTQLDAAQIVRIDAAAHHVTDSIRVGNVPTGIAFLTTTTAAVTNQFDDNVGFVDLVGRQQSGIVAAPSTTFRVLPSADGKHLYATASSGSVGVIALPGHQVEASVDVGGAPNGLAFSPDGGTLYVTAMYGGISAIDTRTNQVRTTFPLAETLQDIAVSPDGSELYVASESAGKIHVLNAATGALKTDIDMAAAVFGLSMTPDGTQLYATGPRTGALWIIDRASHSILKTFSLGGTPRRIAFDEEGKRAVVSNEGGFVTIIE